MILACNGIGTPRLLLNSKSKLFPEGLANSSGLVGRNLMFHPLAFASGVFDEPMEGFKGPPACSVTSHEFYESDPRRDFAGGYLLAPGRGNGPMMDALGGLEGNNPIKWGAAHRHHMDRIYDHTALLCVVSQDMPQEHNQVTLDTELTDSDGVPAPKVIYKQDENNKKILEHGIARSKEVLEAAGAKYTMGDTTVLRHGGWHNMGTARMGDDPKKSVVNSWGRCHDVKNLFIVDGSIFVTAGAVNPTPTIQALALYIGDRIKANLTKLFD